MKEAVKMNSKAEKSKKLFKEGYNCSQAVLGALCDELGMNFETAVKLASSFGGGMGRMREVCGAVSGLFMAIGLKYGYASPDNNAEKAEHYKLIRDVAEEFRKRNGSIICRELLGKQVGENSHIPTKRTAEFYKKRPCSELVTDAVEIFETLAEKDI